MRILLLASLLAIPVPCSADDCDFTDAAGGTGATAAAESLDGDAMNARCQGDTCGPPGLLAKILPGYQLPAPRAHHGTFAVGDATLAMLGEAHTDGRALSAGELVASAQAGWKSGIHVCGRTDVVAGTESRGDSSFHVAFPWPFVEAISIGDEQQWELRPRLDASRIYLRRLYSANDLQFGIGVATWAHADGGTATIFPVRFDLLRRDQDHTNAVFRTWHIAAFESLHADRRTEILPFAIEAMYPHGIGTDAAPLPSSSYLVRVDAATIARHYRGATIELAAGRLFASTPARPAAIAVPVAATAAASWGPWSVRVQRAAHLAMDDVITIEDRLAAAYHDGAWRAGAFAALTHTSSEPTPQLTGGGSAGLDIALPEKLQLALDVEVARSYYARLDADPLPRPELAGIGTVKLERHFTVDAKDLR